jgi:hypothetical protein
MNLFFCEGRLGRLAQKNFENCIEVKFCFELLRDSSSTTC